MTSPSARIFSGKIDFFEKKFLFEFIFISGYKAVSLFDGVAEAYIHTTLIKKWDLCPGHAILKAYEGNMSHLDGTEINYKYDSDTKSEGGMVSSLNHYQEMQAAFKDAYNV
ncbi:unnamed protein product [Oikopleura dioica]|uniref:inositol-phosphate phosphatase n=1 Tax=Oikopleura dioica TaxID=34765 RepID=E4Y8Y4_OIKDI|nr:unnamed protein product [Oikopleura dioica]